MTKFHIVGTTKSVCLCVNSACAVCSRACVIAGSTLTADVLVYESVSATLLMSADLPGSNRTTEVEEKTREYLKLQMDRKYRMNKRSGKS